MPVVTNTLKAPGGAAVKNARVKIRLVASTSDEAAGLVGASDYAVLDELETTTSAAGVWSATLVANSLITPANTYYEITEFPHGRPRVVSTISVPNGAGPYWIGDILTAPAVGPEASALVGATERFWTYPNPAAIAATEVYGANGVSQTDADYFWRLSEADADPAPGYHYDGAGWVNADPITTEVAWWGSALVVPAGRALILPPGTYALTAFVNLSGTLTAPSWARFSWTPLIDPADDELLTDPYYLGSMPGTPAAGEIRYDTTGLHDYFTAIIQHRHSAPVPFVFYAYTPSSPSSPVTIEAYSLGLTRIGGVT